MILSTPLVLTPKTLSLNPNADVFHSLTPPTMPPNHVPSVAQWTDPEQLHAVADTRGIPGHVLVNGGDLTSGVIQMAVMFPPTSESPASSDYAVTTTRLDPTRSPFVSNSDVRSSTDETSPLEDFVEPDQLRIMLKRQLEYYFSRENLASDTYLVSQMDADQFVPVSTVANFNQVKRLTRDIDLVVNILRESANVQVDELGEKVRPLHKRCIVILREIPDSTPIEEVEQLFASESCPAFVSCQFAHNNSWYVTFDTEEDAQIAYRYLREEVQTFRGMPIMARIKAKPLLRNSYVAKDVTSDYSPGLYQQQPKFSYSSPVPSVQFIPPQNLSFYSQPQSVSAALWPTNVIYYDPGMAFAANGYVPTATYTPSPLASAPPPVQTCTALTQDLPSPRNRGMKGRYPVCQSLQDHGDVGENEYRRGWQPSGRCVSEDNCYGYEPRRPPRYGGSGPTRAAGPRLDFFHMNNRNASTRTGMDCRSTAPRNPVGIPRSSYSSDADVFHHGYAGNQSNQSAGRCEYTAQEAGVSSSATSNDMALPPRSNGSYKSRRKCRQNIGEASKISGSGKDGFKSNGAVVFELEEKYFPPLPGSNKTSSTNEKIEQKVSDIVSQPNDLSKISPAKAVGLTTSIDVAANVTPTASVSASSSECYTAKPDSHWSLLPPVKISAERTENHVNGIQKMVIPDVPESSVAVLLSTSTSVCSVCPISKLSLSEDENFTSSSKPSYAQMAQRGKELQESKVLKQVAVENLASSPANTFHLKDGSGVIRADARETLGLHEKENHVERVTENGCRLLQNHDQRKLELVPAWN